MAKQWMGLWLFTGLITCLANGCCCTQRMLTCTSCPTGNCGAGPFMQHNSCKSGCGEVYVDEWLNHPPCADDCGYNNCMCEDCRPVRTLLRALWGTPYIAPGCDSCGNHCDSGCSSCSGGHGCSSCGGGGEVTHEHSLPTNPLHSSPATPSKVAPSEPSKAPTPAPVSPSSAKRLSPVKQRTVSTQVRVQQ